MLCNEGKKKSNDNILQRLLNWPPHSSPAGLVALKLDGIVPTAFCLPARLKPKLSWAVFMFKRVLKGQ